MSTHKAKICEYTRPVHVNTQGQDIGVHKASAYKYARPLHIIHKAKICDYTKPMHINTQVQDMGVLGGGDSSVVRVPDS